MRRHFCNYLNNTVCVFVISSRCNGWTNIDEIWYTDQINVSTQRGGVAVGAADARDVAVPCTARIGSVLPVMTYGLTEYSPRRVPRAVTMPLPFNKTLDLKLLKLVRDNPIIYNKKHTKYLDFDTREVVWQKIGDVLNRPAQICKSRWINIRDMMRRKIRDRLRNPSHRSYNYKYEEELTFMLPYFNETSSTDEYADFLDEANCAVEMPEYDQEFERHEREIKPIFRKRDDFMTGDFQELNPADPLDVFLITIGSTLRKFSPYYLNQAKSKIFQVVQDYELQQIVNKDGQSGGSEANR